METVTEVLEPVLSGNKEVPEWFQMTVSHFQQQVVPLKRFCDALGKAAKGKLFAVASTGLMTNLRGLVAHVNAEHRPWNVAEHRPWTIPLPPADASRANQMVYSCPWQCWYESCSECFEAVRIAYRADVHALGHIYQVPSAVDDLWPPKTTRSQRREWCSAPCAKS